MRVSCVNETICPELPVNGAEYQGCESVRVGHAAEQGDEAGAQYQGDGREQMPLRGEKPSDADGRDGRDGDQRQGGSPTRRVGGTTDPLKMALPSIDMVMPSKAQRSATLKVRHGEIFPIGYSLELAATVS